MKKPCSPRLENKCRTLTESIFANLKPWDISQLSRHPQRPYLLDYLDRIFDEFHELHGDRAFADDHAIVGGNQTTGLDVSPDGTLLAFSDFLDDRVSVYAIPDYEVLLAGDGGRWEEHLIELVK